jgi:hypothetical protein
MGQELGRISGAMLKDNLLRQGIDLVFDTDLLYLNLDSSNSADHKVGINTDSITRELVINDSAKTTNLIIDNPVLNPGTGEITINGNTNTITFLSETIVFPSDVITNNLLADGIGIRDNAIRTLESNANLEFRPNGTGEALIYSDVTFFGGVTSTSIALNYNGNTIIGSIESGDTLDFRARINSSLIPKFTNTSDIGQTNLQWRTAYINKLESDQLVINDTGIFTKNSNANLELQANGLGYIELDQILVRNNSINSLNADNIEINPATTLDIFADTNINGNLYTNEDITFDGNIIIGNSNVDTANFQADIISDILPNLDNLYNLGSQSKRWRETYITTGNVGAITVDVFPIDQIPNFALRQGNIWYVASLGNDNNVGDHQQGAFATIKKALESASSGDTVYIYPGEYAEELPLIVPQGVSVRGSDIRQVIVKPNSSAFYEDVFLLNGETTVEDLTVKGILYNSIADKGYAFRFANSATITTRSPYVKNVTVLTQGSIISTGDPRGFNIGDAGRGALVDGSVVSSSSIEASMLFYSVTFIVPNAVGLYMKNGVRVEWLNCFTYFASTSLLAENGSTGRLTNDGSTIKYGAEVRSIASASVYGTYGAVANGNSTLMYLINHNFAYIGVNKETSNDKTLVIEENEIVKSNNGKIYYSSVDHRGKFKVGDVFFVDLEKGLTSIDVSSVDISGIQSVVFTTGSNVTVADSNKIETGNLRLTGNSLLSENGDINIYSITNQINLTSNTLVTENLNIANNLTLQGNLFFGNTTADRVDFNSKISSDLIPTTDKIYNLGSSSFNFLDAFINQWISDNFVLDTNRIEATNSNSDLELRSNGSGTIKIDQLTFRNSTLNSSLTEVVLDPTSQFTFSNSVVSRLLLAENNLEINDSVIIGSNGIDTLELRSKIINDLIPTEQKNLGSNSIQWNTIYASKFDNDQLAIFNNKIVSTESNANLEIRGGSGVSVSSINVNNTQLNNLNIINNNIIVNNDTVVSQDLSATGSFTVSGNISVGNQQSDSVAITAEISTDLIPQNDKIYSLGSNNKRWSSINVKQLKTDNIEFNTNYISTTDSNSNLEFVGSGTGKVLIDGLSFKNNIFSSIVGNTVLSSLGSILINKSTNVNGDLNISGDLTFEGNLVVGNNPVDTVSVVGAIDSNIIPDQTESYDLGSNLKYWKTLYINRLFTDQIEVFSNIIRVTESNSNLDLKSNNTGSVNLNNTIFKNTEISSLPNQKINLKPYSGYSLIADSTASIKIPSGTSAQWISPELGDMRLNSVDGLFEARANNSRTTLGGVFSDDKRTRLYAENNVIRFFADNVETLTVTTAGVTLNGLNIDDQLSFDNNVISSTATNADINLLPQSGFITINDIRIGNSNIINQHDGALILKSSGTGYYNFQGTNGITIPAGTTSERPLNPQLSQIRFNTELNDLEVYDGTTWVPAGGAASEVTEEQLTELHEIYALIFG